MSDTSSEIIAHQYLNKIADLHHLTVRQIESVNEIPDQSFIEDNNLYIIKTDEWNIPDTHDNCIVICNKTKDGRAIKFPKLESWQVIDFVRSKIDGIDSQVLDNLIERYNGNYWRFINDLDKLSEFNKTEQNLLFKQMIDEHQFDHISNYKIWD